MKNKNQFQQLYNCLICGKWFAEWKIKTYSDETVQKLCPFCNYPQQIKQEDK